LLLADISTTTLFVTILLGLVDFWGCSAGVIIPDIDLGIINWILKFADDTKIFGKVTDQASRDILQEDLTKLYNWSQDWQMDLNVEKCKVMHIGPSNPEYKYLMNSHVLQEVNQEKDLGIMITSNLKSFSQVTEAYKKANGTWHDYPLNPV